MGRPLLISFLSGHWRVFMPASSTPEAMAQTVCQKISARRDLFPSGCAAGQEVLDVQSGVAEAIERGWLACREDGYVLTREGQEVAHKTSARL